MKTEDSHWLDLSTSEMDAIIAGLEIEMRETKDDTGFYRYDPKTRFHSPNRLQVSSAVRGDDRYARPKFRLGLFLVSLFLMAGGLYGIVLLLTEILELEGR